MRKTKELHEVKCLFVMRMQITSDTQPLHIHSFFYRKCHVQLDHGRRMAR